MARLQLGPQVVLPRLLVGEDPAAADRVQGVELTVELLSAGGHPCVSDADLGADGGFGGQEFEVGVFKWRAHARNPVRKRWSEVVEPPGFLKDF